MFLPNILIIDQFTLTSKLTTQYLNQKMKISYVIQCKTETKNARVAPF